VLGQKGISILKYKKEDYQHAYEVLKKSIAQMGSQSSAPVILTFMQSSRQLFIDGTIDAGQVLSDYETTMEIADANLKITPDDDGFLTAKDGIESYFSNSGAASCEALTKLYGPKLGALKDDPEWLKKVTKQLKKAGCMDIQLFRDASESLYLIEPSAEAAHNIAAMFMRSEQFDRAAEYLQKGIDIGTGSPELPDMYYELAFLTFQHEKNYQKTRALALKAIEGKPNWGKPYLLIGQAYIAARNQVFNDDWDRKTVFWVAVDKFIKAKSVDPEVTDEANNLINTYSEYFPNNEEVFFRTLKDGDSYTVGGWINETTKIRAKRL
jgi:tetratricopeptide (TPR) repeat protein